MIDLPPDFPEFEWPLHEMLFYRSMGSTGKYLICARGPGDDYRYGNEIVMRKEFDTHIEANHYLSEITRLQALTKALLR
jgi:hypothetical protein